MTKLAQLLIILFLMGIMAITRRIFIGKDWTKKQVIVEVLVMTVCPILAFAILSIIDLH